MPDPKMISHPRRARTRQLAFVIAGVTLTACASTQEPAETVSVTADQAWVQSACEPASPDTTGWPRYQLGNITIAVPPQFRRGRDRGFTMRFVRGTSSLSIGVERVSSLGLVRYNLPGQVVCDADYGGFPTEALSWRGQGQYLVVAQWPRLNEPAERNSVHAVIRTTRLSDAIALRHALHTIQRTEVHTDPEEGSPDAWFYSPCLSDSVDSFEWTRYDLRGIRIRVPREFRREPFPSPDELHFKSGRTTLRLRLHNDASQLFTSYHRPGNTFRYCTGEMGGLAVEAVSFGTALNPGFAARWADADRGEWLTAVVHGRSLGEVTALRRALFTLTFPGAKH